LKIIGIHTMSRIDNTFKELKKKNQKALIPFLMAGDPDLYTTEELILKIFENGADMIELGIPYSDPIADGKTIQASSKRALEKKIHIDHVFELLKGLNGKIPPIIIMTYYNPVLRYGLRRFTEEAKKSGIDGVIISDLPPEEANSWIKEAKVSGVDTIFLASPTTPFKRIRYISRLTSGFLYYVQFTGVTGMRGYISEDIEQRLKKIKSEIKKPVVVGFGISNPEQAKTISSFSDCVVIGSAIIKIIEESISREEVIKNINNFIFQFSRVLKEGVT